MFKTLILATLVFSFSAQAQNSTSWITRPISNVVSDTFPASSFWFENNLMNHISDYMRLEEAPINSKIACIGDSHGKLFHSNELGWGSREVEIQCQGNKPLEYAKSVVSRLYNHGMGNNLKYAFESGPFIFAVCNYDEGDKHSNHSHHDGHYVCRVPKKGESQSGSIETFCYEMSWLHRTCNPHKALVATELIPINSISRWESIDKTILMRFLGQNIESKELIIEMVNDIRNSLVRYSSKRRGSPDADKRYPKIFKGDKYACFESLISSNDKYILTDIECADISILSYGQRMRLSSKVINENLILKKTLKRLKQRKTEYSLIDGMRSSVD